MIRNNVHQYLATNLLYLRRKRDMSQKQLAQLAGIPRTTLTNMESGSGNPSLTNLVKLASALSIGIEALLARPRNQCELVLAKDIPLQEKSKGKALMYKLLPDKIKGIEIDRIELEALSTMGGQPHLSGTKEYLTVIKGEITMYISGEIYSVKKGDVLAFPGNQAHSYRNNKNTSAIALSVVVPVPSSL